MKLIKYGIEYGNTEESKELLNFGYYICDLIYSEINTKLVRKKIQLRIPYLYTVNWIQWKRKYIDVDDIMKTIYESLEVKPERYNYVIYINEETTIPNSITKADKLIRFLDAGDMKVHRYKYIIKYRK